MWFESAVLASEPGTEINIGQITPRELEYMGYRRAGGFPVGQLHDYRKALPDGRGIHVRLYATHAAAHLERYDPSVNLLGHMITDAPAITLGGIALGIWAWKRWA